MIDLDRIWPKFPNSDDGRRRKTGDDGEEGELPKRDVKEDPKKAELALGEEEDMTIEFVKDFGDIEDVLSCSRMSVICSCISFARCRCGRVTHLSGQR